MINNLSSKTNEKVEIMGISRLRMGTDGKGISTLVTFYGCPLRCKYCLNPQCNQDDTKRKYINPENLIDLLLVDDIYFCSTGGGVVFGGGEPLLHTDYISEVCKLMPKKWQVRVETSFIVAWDKIEKLIPFVDEWIIDIKDSNDDIYRNYTGVEGHDIYDNVIHLSEIIGQDKIVIRIPLIPGFNTKKDVKISEEKYSELGRIDKFEYKQFSVI